MNGRRIAIWIAILLGLAILFFVAGALAPFLIPVALIFLLLAWKRPSVANWLAGRRWAQRFPAQARTTSLRFATVMTALVIAFSGVGALVVYGSGLGNNKDNKPKATAAIGVAAATSTVKSAATVSLATTANAAKATDTPKPTNTPKPTATPKPTPTPKPPTATPAPTDTPAPTNTPEPTATPAPTDTPTEVPPTATATPLPAPIAYDGSGDDVIDITKPEGADSVAIAYIKGNDSGSFFAVAAYDDSGKQLELLVNTTDPYEGIVPIDFLSGETTSRLQVQASGDWHIEIRPLASARVITAPGQLAGTGDEVLVISGNPDTAHITGNASGTYFGVIAYGNHTNLLVNTTDPYDGTVIVNKDAQILQVTATGDWSVTFP